MRIKAGLGTCVSAGFERRAVAGGGGLGRGYFDFSSGQEGHEDEEGRGHKGREDGSGVGAGLGNVGASLCNECGAA